MARRRTTSSVKERAIQFVLARTKMSAIPTKRGAAKSAKVREIEALLKDGEFGCEAGRGDIAKLVSLIIGETVTYGEKSDILRVKFHSFGMYVPLEDTNDHGIEIGQPFLAIKSDPSDNSALSLNREGEEKDWVFQDDEPRLATEAEIRESFKDWDDDQILTFIPLT